MKSSCISYPAKEPLLLIRKSQVDFCDGHACAAALISFFQYWHDIKIDISAKNKVANDISEGHGDERHNDETLLQFHSMKELSDGIMGLYGDKSIKSARNLLIDKGVISEHRNPSNRYKFDRTIYYLFHPEIIENWLSYRYRKNTGRSIENTGRSIENTGRSIENTVTITEVSLETPLEVSLETLNQEKGHFAKSAKSHDANAPSPTPEKQKPKADVEKENADLLNKIAELEKKASAELEKVKAELEKANAELKNKNDDDAKKPKADKPEKPKPLYETIDLPDFIDRKLWIEWQQERKTKNKSSATQTERAFAGHIRYLTELEQQGYPANECLIILGDTGWLGVTPDECIKRINAKRNRQAQTSHETAHSDSQGLRVIPANGTQPSRKPGYVDFAQEKEDRKMRERAEIMERMKNERADQAAIVLSSEDYQTLKEA